VLKRTVRILDDADIPWLWDGEWLKVEGDDTDDGGEPASTIEEVLDILIDGGYIE
jgi:hypothetical protein